MCGRYAVYDISKLDFDISHNMINKNYNIVPTTIVPVVFENNEVRMIKWNYKVAWADKLNIINARSETLMLKKVFENAKRCIFIANGYFEWLRQDNIKIPYYHTFRNRMMYFGGICNEQGACIVTRQSYPRKVEVHQRQPVILSYNDFPRWFALDHDYTCEHSIKMEIFEVSAKVNSPKNNAPENIKRINRR